ncbi:AAA family ATPase, partial [Enterococcus faecalis]
MGKTISFANFKGGVGKTSTTALVGYSLAKMGKKVLLVDLDAQANLTALMIKTSSKDNNITTIDKSLMKGITENINPKELTITIKENLSLIPNAVDFSVYSRFLEKNFSNEIDRIQFLKSYLSPVVNEYDYI